MLKKTIADTSSGKIIVMDTFTKLETGDEGSIVLFASHGGASSCEFTLQMPLHFVQFDDADIVALDILEKCCLGGAAISHVSGRIDDAQYMWDHGVISAVNPRVTALCVVVGDKESKKLLSLIAGRAA